LRIKDAPFDEPIVVCHGECVMTIVGYPMFWSAGTKVRVCQVDLPQVTAS
jgi:hypothetical protein